MDEPIPSFDDLPSLTATILEELRELRSIVDTLRPPKPDRRPILVDEACKILGKAKATVYNLARQGQIPACRQGRKVYFFEDELLA